MRLFGTDGIRGEVNKSPMTPEMVLRVGMASAKILRRPSGRNMILIGKDTRLSGYMIESALTSGICSMGMNVTLLGPMPTPGVAFLTRALRADAGIVISASHNPFEDNGIKFFSSDGLKLPDSVEDEIEGLVFDDGLMRQRPHGAEIGRAYRLDDAVGRYIEYIKSTIPRGMTLEGIKVVVDCANGAAYKVTPWVLRELGAEVIVINDKPNGININKDCGSLHIDALSSEVKRQGADIGIAHDGDADRAIFVDERGRAIDGDHVLGIWAEELKSEGRLRGDAVVATVMSNLGLEHFLNSKGIRLIRTRVGDRYVTERMLEGGYNLGGEQSGHIVCFDYNSTGDGPITALHIISLMKKKGVRLSELIKGIRLYPQCLINVVVKERKDPKSEPSVRASILEAERALKENGRILVRASGTEPKIRVMVEGKDKRIVRETAERLADIIKRKMG